MSVSLQMVVPESTRPGDDLVVVGDWGASLSGDPQILTPGPAPAFDRTVRAKVSEPLAGWHREPWAAGPYLDRPHAGGFHRGRWHETDWHDPFPLRDVSVKRLYGYGPLTVAVRPASAVDQSDAGAPTPQTLFFVEEPLELAAVAHAGVDGNGTLGISLTHGTHMEAA